MFHVKHWTPARSCSGHALSVSRPPAELRWRQGNPQPAHSLLELTPGSAVRAATARFQGFTIIRGGLFSDETTARNVSRETLGTRVTPQQRRSGATSLGAPLHLRGTASSCLRRRTLLRPRTGIGTSPWGRLLSSETCFQSNGTMSRTTTAD